MYSSRGGCPGFPVPNTNSPYRRCGHKATVKKKKKGGIRAKKLCIHVEVDVLGSPALIVRTISVKQHSGVFKLV